MTCLAICQKRDQICKMALCKAQGNILPERRHYDNDLKQSTNYIYVYTVLMYMAFP